MSEQKLSTYLLVLLLCLAPAQAKQQLISKNTINLDIPITEKVFLRLASSTRLDDELTSMDVQLFRTAINYEFNKDLVFTASHDWFKLFDHNASYGNRLSQQIYYRHDSGLEKLRLFHRLRIDERMLEDISTQVRTRYMLGAEYPLSKTITAVISDEIIVNLNTNEESAAGFGQNRIYIGCNKKFGDKTTMSLGYQRQDYYLDRELTNHGIILALTLSLR